MRMLVVLVVFATLALTESALASTASVESTDVGPMITIVGGDENSNVWIADGSLWIHDDAGITADMGCTEKTATAVDCGLTVGGWITAYLGGGDDSIGQLVATGQLWEVHGGPGNDTIRGDNAENWLFGDEGDDFVRGWMGNDVIDGGPGVDALYGDRSIFLTPEGGDDTITSRDTEPDEVWCDYGFDTVTADALDTIDLDCEQVDRGVAPAVTPPAITPPAITPPSAAPPTVAPPASKALPRMTVSTAKRYVKRALAKRYRGWRKGTHRVLAKPLRVSRVTVKFRSVSVRYRAHTYRGWAQAKYYLKGGKVHVRTTVHLKRR